MEAQTVAVVDEEREAVLREAFQEYALTCFIMATNGVKSAVRLGKTVDKSGAPVIFLHLDNRTDDCRVQPKPYLPPGHPARWRMYLEVNIFTADHIGEDALDLTLSSDYIFLAGQNGLIARPRSAEINLHVCPGGVDLIFHSTLQGYDKFFLRMGNYRAGTIPPYYVPPVLTVERRSMETTVLACFSTLYQRDKSVIRLGSGSHNGMSIFVQFGYGQMAGCPAHVGGENAFNFRSYRIYLPLFPGERERIRPDTLDSCLCDDERFKRFHNGRIVKPMELNVNLHVCERGVMVYYKCGLPPYDTYNQWLGSARAIGNCFIPRTQRDGNRSLL